MGWGMMAKGAVWVDGIVVIVVVDWRDDWDCVRIWSCCGELLGITHYLSGWLRCRVKVVR